MEKTDLPEKVLFVTNKLFVDENKPEGGVRLCTEDFIKLLKSRYQVVIFKLEFNRSLVYRLKAKIGVDLYEDYDIKRYAVSLAAEITKAKINKVFINLSNASAMAIILKKSHPNVKVILCSHGNESGDFLHQSGRFTSKMSSLPRFFSAWRLGRVLQKELEFRTLYLDLVLSISEVEESLEKWLGAKQTFMIPRVFSPDFINWRPVPGRVGFLADLSHYPNYYGLLRLCIELKRINLDKTIELRVVGRLSRNLTMLKKEFPFISATGYLNDKELKQEAGSWMYYLNLVFYYSKGVSTKLAKGMNWGLPILSTKPGNRGYVFEKGGVVTCENVEEMAKILEERAFDKNMVNEDRARVLDAVEAFSDINKVMKNLYPVLENL